MNKPLSSLLALILFAALPAAAQKNSKPKQAAAEPQAAPAGADPTVDDLAAALIKQDPALKADAADTAEAAADVKGKFRLLHKADEKGGRVYQMIVPKEISAAQKLTYKSVHEGVPAPIILKRAWLHGHYLILEFDSQQQYMDLRKADPVAGFKLGGYVSKDKAAHDFADADAYEHAVKKFVQKPLPAGLADKVKRLAAGKPYALEGAAAGKKFKTTVKIEEKLSTIAEDGAVSDGAAPNKPK